MNLFNKIDYKLNEPNFRLEEWKDLRGEIKRKQDLSQKIIFSIITLNLVIFAFILEKGSVSFLNACLIVLPVICTKLAHAWYLKNEHSALRIAIYLKHYIMNQSSQKDDFRWEFILSKYINEEISFLRKNLAFETKNKFKRELKRQELIKHLHKPLRIILIWLIIWLDEFLRRIKKPFKRSKKPREIDMLLYPFYLVSFSLLIINPIFSSNNDITLKGSKTIIEEIGLDSIDDDILNINNNNLSRITTKVISSLPIVIFGILLFFVFLYYTHNKVEIWKNEFIILEELSKNIDSVDTKKWEEGIEKRSHLKSKIIKNIAEITPNIQKFIQENSPNLFMRFFNKIWISLNLYWSQKTHPLDDEKEWIEEKFQEINNLVEKQLDEKQLIVVEFKKIFDSIKIKEDIKNCIGFELRNEKQHLLKELWFSWHIVQKSLAKNNTGQITKR